MAEIAKQGHLYLLGDSKVIALATGSEVRVAPMSTEPPWLGPAINARAEWLVPQPMGYFHGDIPE